MRRHIGAFVLIGFAASSAPAAAATITFDTVSGQTVTAFHSEAGFDVNWIAGVGHILSSADFPIMPDDGSYYGLTAPVGGGPGFASSFRVTRTGGGTFTFSSFMGAESGFANEWASAISVAGTKADLSTVSASFLLDGFNDGLGGQPDFEAFAFGPTDLFVSLDFTGIVNPASGGRDFSVDNIVLTAVDVTEVPEPASLALLGTGLAWVARRARRRTSRSVR